MWGVSIRGAIMLVLLAGATCGCGKGSNGQINRDRIPSIIIISRDAAVPVADAAVKPDAAGAAAAPLDATAADVWRDPSSVFPDCKGTAEQVSNCIINQPARSGVPVTRPDPMDYNLCRP